jgi:VWFA-related protein
MTHPSVRRWLAAGFILFALIAVGLTGVSARSQGTDKTLFVAVTDASGKPLTDVKVSEFAVREDNVNREVISVKSASKPLYVYLLADTSRQAGNTGFMGRETSTGGTELIRDIRNSLTDAVKTLNALQPEAQIALMEFGQAAITVTKFTNKLPDLEKGINRLYPKPEAGSVILEAMIEASKLLAKVPSGRRAIITLNIEPGEEESRQEPKKLYETLRESGANLWSISLQKGQLRNAQRDVVLNELTKWTGGRREFQIGPVAIKNSLTQFVETLASEYELTYKRPDSSSNVQMVQVGTTRPGSKTYASMFAPK